MEPMGTQLGLSKKTNVAIAAMTTLSIAKDSWYAIIAISVVALASLLIQGRIDLKKIKTTTNEQEEKDETE